MLNFADVRVNRSIIPRKPGVYMYISRKKDILYVGKAIDLYSRISSYFSQRDPRTTTLVKKTSYLDFIVVESELEALILEANLIKKNLPQFNIRLTDDKDYLYIKVTKAIFPQIVTARKKDLKDVLKFYGPFPSARTVKETLKRLRRIFPWCARPPSSDIGYRISDIRLRPCFYYHIKLCPGPCVGKISQKEYKKIINRFIRFMEGDKEGLFKELSQEMGEASQSLDFEKAALTKKMIEGIIYLTQPNRVKLYLENPNYLDDEKKQALKELKRILNLPTLPSRIEAFDISNIQGKNASGSLVVLTNGEIDKSQYRKFRIRVEDKPNDVGMHQEVMRRRLNHSEWPLPDLMLIDGGIAQARAAESIIIGRGLSIPVYGLAKRFEWLYKPDGEIIKLPKANMALRLLQKVRDEAHRFAISYHKKLRGRALIAAI